MAAAVRSLRRKEEERDVPGLLAVSRSFQFTLGLDFSRVHDSKHTCLAVALSVNRSFVGV